MTNVFSCRDLCSQPASNSKERIQIKPNAPSGICTTIYFTDMQYKNTITFSSISVTHSPHLKMAVLLSRSGKFLQREIKQKAAGSFKESCCIHNNLLYRWWPDLQHGDIFKGHRWFYKSL